jgi:hypothetical protein
MAPNLTFEVQVLGLNGGQHRVDHRAEVRDRIRLPWMGNDLLEQRFRN